MSVLECLGPSWYLIETKEQAEQMGYGKPCLRPVRYIRYTQFSGKYCYCDIHGPIERDFMENDSYGSWEEIKDE